MFLHVSDYNQSIGDWNSVTNMYRMSLRFNRHGILRPLQIFNVPGASDFNQTIENWSHLEGNQPMGSGMFQDANDPSTNRSATGMFPRPPTWVRCSKTPPPSTNQLETGYVVLRSVHVVRNMSEHDVHELHVLQRDLLQSTDQIGIP